MQDLIRLWRKDMKTGEYGGNTPGNKRVGQKEHLGGPFRCTQII